MLINEIIDLFCAWWGVICALLVVWALKQGGY